MCGLLTGISRVCGYSTCAELSRFVLRVQCVDLTSRFCVGGVE